MSPLDMSPSPVPQPPISHDFPLTGAGPFATPDLERGWRRAVWADQVAVADEAWLVDRLVPCRSHVGLFGRRGSAKSFLALDLAFRGALGLPFLGRETQRFGTVYCVGEKEEQFGKRVVAWRKARGLEDNGGMPPALELAWGVPDLLNAAEVAEFAAWLVSRKAEFAARGAPLELVILDTLARCLPTAHVTDPEAANRAIGALQHIVRTAAVTVIPLAHVAKAQGSDSQKGPGEWEDAATALIRIERKEGGLVRTVTNNKQSDEKDGGIWAFELEPVTVGTNSRGGPIISCVVREVDPPPKAEGPEARSKSNPACEMILAVLERLMADGPTAAGPSGQTAVRLKDLHDATYDFGLCRLSEPPEAWGEDKRAQWVDTRKKTFRRALDLLIEAGALRMEGDWVWPGG